MEGGVLVNYIIVICIYYYLYQYRFPYCQAVLFMIQKMLSLGLSMQVQRVSPAKVHPDDSEGPEHCEAERHLVLIQLPCDPIRNHPVFTCLLYMAGTLQPSNETNLW